MPNGNCRSSSEAIAMLKPFHIIIIDCFIEFDLNNLNLQPKEDNNTYIWMDNIVKYLVAFYHYCYLHLQ